MSSSISRGLHQAGKVAPTGIHDVVIIGGGPNGLALAAALRSASSTRSLKVMVVDSQDLHRSTILPSGLSEFSNRCVSLTPRTIRFLDSIGATEHLNASRVQKYDGMNVWDGLSGQKILFDWDTAAGLPSLASIFPFMFARSDVARSSSTARLSGHTIATMAENANITGALLKRIDSLGDVVVRDNVSVESINLGHEDEGGLDLRRWPIVTLSDGASVAARLLVGADGGNSPVRQFADIRSQGWDYERHAVVATLRLEEPQDHSGHATAYQRFLPTGPCALLPLPGPYASLVWSTTPAHAAHLRSLSPEDLIAMVNAAFRLSPIDLEYMHTQTSGQVEELAWRLRHTSYDATLAPRYANKLQERSVAAFPLRMRHVDTYIGERVALIGDAAHSIHPLAGQGLNSGLADVEALASTILEAVENGSDIGSTLSLERYNSARFAANHILLGAVDKLHKLYSLQSPPIVSLRSWGLGVVNGWGSLKRAIMSGAGGA